MIKLYTIKQGTAVNHPKELEHSDDTITRGIRRIILRSKEDRVCKIPCYLIGDGGRAGHLAQAFKEEVYAGGENGNKEVRYNPREAINLSPKAVRILKDKFGD